MYRRLTAVLFPICLIALVGAGVWGYQVNQEKNAVLLKAENQYQRAFHDLSFHMERLQTELGNTIAVSSTSSDFYRKGLINVWRITSQAQSEINQLPLTLLPFNKTEDFLKNISAFSYRTAVRNLDNKPISDEERKTLHQLYDHAKEISAQLQDVQGKVLANGLRWMDVELAIASQDENADNTIVDGFQTVDKKVGEYSELDWGPSMNAMFQKRNFSLLDGQELTVEEIKDNAAKFLGLSDKSNLKVTENGQGLEYSSFSVTGSKQGTDEVQLDFSKKGGNLLWFMATRNVETKNLDVRGARDAAAEFLDLHGFQDMSAIGYDESYNVGIVSFARRQGDVLIYPEKVTVHVALDQGDILGMQATDYVFEHRQRQWADPKITSEQAAKQLSAGFNTYSKNLALIRNELDEEVLCHEFNGSINGNDYKIFINAETGYEEKIEQIGTTEGEEASV